MSEASTRVRGPNGGTSIRPALNRGKTPALRLVSFAALVAAYFLIDWAPFQTAFRNLMGDLLSLIGKPGSTAEICAAPCLLLPGGRIYAFAANCVYINLFLMTAPFVWRFGRPRGENFFRLVSLAAALLVVNVFRLAAAFVFHGRGTPWIWAHDLPDALIRLSIIAGLAVAAMKADAHRCDSPADMRNRREDI